MIAFILTFPNNACWNGKFTGEGKLYCQTRKLSTSKEKELSDKGYFYNFGDGWSVEIYCKKVNSRDATKLRKRSQGFYGYSWMIDSIINNGKILKNNGTKTETIEVVK